jgi:NTP pyrophosphatase (non-canonical NTP hydrolase)
MKSITQFCQEVYDWSKRKGWWDRDKPFGDQATNFHGEISEAWEEYRKYGMNPDKFLYDNEDPKLALQIPDKMRGLEGMPPTEKMSKPEGIAAELADLLIRVFDTCGHYGIPLEHAIEKKMRYNELRSYRHGGKVA